MVWHHRDNFLGKESFTAYPRDETVQLTDPSFPLIFRAAFGIIFLPNRQGAAGLAL
jgi:hypothetical protein